MKKILIKIPDKIDSDKPKEQLLNKEALELYKTREYSLGYCANLSALCYADFMKFVSDNKINLFEYTIEEIKKDIENA